MKNNLKRFMLILVLVFIRIGDCTAMTCGGALGSSEFGFSVVESREEKSVPLISLVPQSPNKLNFKYTEIRTRNGRDFNEREIFGDESDLIIGIDITGDSKGHTYLVMNDVRIDGRMYFFPTTYSKGNWTLNQGMVLRFKGLSEENKDKLRQWISLEVPIKSADCVVTACKILFNIGDFQKNVWGSFVLPSSLIHNLVVNGLKNDHGSTSFPEVSLINIDLKTFWDGLPSLKTIPQLLLKVLFNPYTYQGLHR